MDFQFLFSNTGLAHILENIFSYFSFEDIKNCLQVSKQWRICIQTLKTYDEIMIVYFAQQSAVKFKIISAQNSTEWKNVIDAARSIKAKKDIKILVDIVKFYKTIQRPKKFSLKLWTPFYVSCWENKVDFVRFLLPYLDEKNPQIANNSSIFHVMAREGLTEVCQCIMEHLGKDPVLRL